MNKREPGGVLTAAELKQRRDAAHSHRHRAETALSVRQGSSGPPSRSAVGLFRQGQARPDTRSSRGVWDTRTSEQPVGSMKARFKLHFPKAYRSSLPDELLPHDTGGRPLLAEALSGSRPIKGSQHKLRGDAPFRDLVIDNPGTFVDAVRHPRMAAIMARSVGVVREHQKGAIEKGIEKGLIPRGTSPGLVAQAYKHAALLALHRAGLGDYDFGPMDEPTKAELRPLVPFMRYAHRRVFDRLHTENPQAFEPFKVEFGEKFSSRKHGKLTGTERYRMRPNERFIKRAPAREVRKMEKLMKAAGQAGKFGDKEDKSTAIRGAQLVGGAAGGMAAGMGLPHTKFGRALSGHVDRIADKAGRAAESRFRFHARRAGAFKPGGAAAASHPLGSLFQPKPEHVLRAQGKLAGHIARGATKFIGHAGVAGGAFAVGDYLGDRIARRIGGDKEKHYRHFNALGFGLGTAGAVGAHMLTHARFARKLMRRIPHGKGKLLAAGVGLTAAAEAVGTRIQDRVGQAFSGGKKAHKIADARLQLRKDDAGKHASNGASTNRDDETRENPVSSRPNKIRPKISGAHLGQNLHLTVSQPVPLPPGGLPPPAHHSHHIRHAARAVEHHFQVGKSEGSVSRDVTRETSTKPPLRKVRGRAETGTGLLSKMSRGVYAGVASGQQTNRSAALESDLSSLRSGIQEARLSAANPVQSLRKSAGGDAPSGLRQAAGRHLALSAVSLGAEHGLTKSSLGSAARSAAARAGWETRRALDAARAGGIHAGWHAADQFNRLHVRLENAGRRLGTRAGWRYGQRYPASIDEPHVERTMARGRQPKGHRETRARDVARQIGGRALPALAYAGAGATAGAAVGYAAAHRRKDDVSKLGKISGSGDPEMQKVYTSFLLGDPDPGPSYNTNPAMLLRRAMKPRIAHRRPKIRLNTQRHLRVALSGPVPRRDRWLIIAKGEGVDSTGGLEKGVIGDAMRFGAKHVGAGLGAIGGAASRGFGHTKAGIGSAGRAVWRGPVGNAGRGIANSKFGQKVQASPRFQAMRNEGREVVHEGGFREGYGAAIGRIAGAGIGGEKGAKIGRNVGWASEYWPEAVAGGALIGHLAGGKKKDKKEETAEKIAPPLATVEAIRQTVRRGAKAVRAKPGVARVLDELREQGAPKTPGWRLGRLAGAAVAGERGAKIGGRVGRAVEVAPLVYAGAHVLSDSDRRNKAAKEQINRIKNLPDTMLGKGFLGAAAGLPVRAAGRVLGGGLKLAGRTVQRHRLASGLAIGAAALPAMHALREDPAKQAGVGALAGAAIGSIVSRGRAGRNAVRVAGRTFRDAMKTPWTGRLQHLAGKVGHPLQQDAAKELQHVTSLAHAKAKQAGAAVSRRSSAKAVMGGAIAGAAAATTAGIAVPPKSKWDSVPPG